MSSEEDDLYAQIGGGCLVLVLAATALVCCGDMLGGAGPPQEPAVASPPTASVGAPEQITDWTLNNGELRTEALRTHTNHLGLTMQPKLLVGCEGGEATVQMAGMFFSCGEKGWCSSSWRVDGVHQPGMTRAWDNAAVIQFIATEEPQGIDLLRGTILDVRASPLDPTAMFEKGDAVTVPFDTRGFAAAAEKHGMTEACGL